jgi:hypothetical protein
MELKEVIKICHIRSAVYRASKPDQKYWKNSKVPIEQKVPEHDKDALDWLEYDPRDHDSCSLSCFND